MNVIIIYNACLRGKAMSQDLPVLAYREKILDLLIENRTIVVVGETGSGKTTQIPQYLRRGEQEGLSL